MQSLQDLHLFDDDQNFQKQKEEQPAARGAAGCSLVLCRYKTQNLEKGESHEACVRVQTQKRG